MMSTERDKGLKRAMARRRPSNDELYQLIREALTALERDPELQKRFPKLAALMKRARESG